MASHADLCAVARLIGPSQLADGQGAPRAGSEPQLAERWAQAATQKNAHNNV